MCDTDVCDTADNLDSCESQLGAMYGVTKIIMFVLAFERRLTANLIYKHVLSMTHSSSSLSSANGPL